MNRFFFLLFILLTFFSVNNVAQDTIHFANGNSIIAKIIQIKTNDLTYKDFSNLEGPDYVVELEQIGEIHFKNGFVQKYNDIKNNGIEYVNDVPVKPRTSGDSVFSQKIEKKVSPKQFNSYEEKRDYYKDVPYQYKSGDKINPGLSAAASYFIPGLGQIISGETGRGVVFLGGVYGSALLMSIGMSGLHSDYPYDISQTNNRNNNALFAGLAIGGSLIMTGAYIWNIIDAYQVARINNLYNRDLAESKIDIQLSPSITPVNFHGQQSFTLGAKLSIRL